MKPTVFQKLALGLSGVTALAIGSAILFVPHAFYASYGIALGPDPNMLSELRAPGAGLAALGGIMLAGLIRAALLPAALTVALAVYIAFPAGRVVSVIADGMPSGSVIGALAVEIVIACLLLAAFRPRRAATSVREPVVDLPG